MRPEFVYYSKNLDDYPVLALSGIFLTTCCKERKVSGGGCQGKQVLDTDT